MDEALRKRILSKIIVNEEGCWVWQGAVRNTGYAQIMITIEPKKPKNRRVHRIAYEEWRGPIPEGLDLDHICHKSDGPCWKVPCVHRRCVNPYHVEPVTRKENIRRGNARKVLDEYFNSITHCIHGHEYTEENTYLQPAFPHYRKCRICIRTRTRLRYENKIHNKNEI